jgi:hypothetical protein
LQPRLRRSQSSTRTRKLAIAYAPIVGTRDAVRGGMTKSKLSRIDLHDLQTVTGGQRDNNTPLPHVPTEHNGSIVPTRYPAGGGGGVGLSSYMVMR